MNIRKLLVVMIAAFTMAAVGCSKEKTDDAAKADDTAAAKPADPAAAKAAMPADHAKMPADHAAKAAAAPAGDNKEWNEMGTKTVEIFSSIAKVAADNKGDCDKIGDGVAKILGDNKEFIDKAKALDKNEEAKKYMETHFKAKLMGAMMPLMQTAQECQGNEKFKAAMSSM